MTKKLIFGLFSLILLSFSSCKKDPEAETKSNILIDKSWKLTRVTDTNGTTIAESRLGLATQVIFGMTIEFLNNNRVRAVDLRSGQVLNGGTWYLKEDDTLMSIDVNGFTGDFKVVQMSATALTLQQSNVPVDGKQQAANLEFARQ